MMSIRSKALSIIGFTVLLLVAVLLLLSRFVMQKSIYAQEAQTTQKDVESILKILDNEFSGMNAVTSDWAAFDDTYRFMNDANEEYISSNLNDETFIILNLNFIIYIDSFNRVVYKRGFSLELEQEMDVPEELLAHFKEGSILLKRSLTDSPVSGILMLEQGPLMISSRPVTNTDSNAPVNGTIIMARFFDHARIQHLEYLAGTLINVQKVGRINNNSDYKTAYEALTGDMKIFVKPESENLVAGYTIIKDVYQKPALVMKAVYPRIIYNHGNKNLRFFLASFLLSGVIIFLVCIWLLQKLVISRLEHLSSFIKETSVSKDTSSRISMTGEDEISSLADVTNSMLSEIHKMHNELKLREERLELVMDSTNDGFWDLNIATGFIYFSPNCALMLGYKPEEIDPNIRAWRLLIHHEDIPVVKESFKEIMEGNTDFINDEYRLLKKDKDWKWILSRGKVVERNERGVPLRMTGTITDITDRKKAEEEIKFLSYNDKLTGIYNRVYFEKELEKADKSGELPFTIMMGDLNGLKITNDVFGHEEGDRLLSKAAAIIKKSCRSNDVIARWGGDEFAAILYGTDEKNCSIICDRIRKASMEADDCIVKPSIALGSATKNEASQDINKLLKEAEEKMYRNKLLEGKSVRSSIITSLEQTLSERSHETEEHTRRIRNMCIRMSYALGLNQDEIDQLVLLATLHDIGKIAIPDNILLKAGPLDASEWEIMRRHPEIGYRIAQSSPELMHIADAILAHHERYDGTGYPQGLKGEHIPLVSRILAIVDAYDVMTHKRPYNEPMSIEQAVVELRRCAGTQFDPSLVEVFVKSNSSI